MFIRRYVFPANRVVDKQNIVRVDSATSSMAADIPNTKLLLANSHLAQPDSEAETAETRRELREKLLLDEID